MRVAFAGTPLFASRILDAILAAGHEVPLVFTQPDRPAGRGLKLTSSAVADLARRHDLSLEKPETLKSESPQQRLRQVNADLLVVAAYGLILPKPVLAIPRFGCLNVHASLLPRWRGAAPVQRAILAGDTETGVDIMRMEPGLDTGPVLLERRLAIDLWDTAGSLTERLAEEGGKAIVQALANLHILEEKAQSESGVTYAAKIDKSEAAVDWSRAAVQIARAVRAFNPAPGATSCWHGDGLKIWEAHVVAGARGTPGTFVGAHNGLPLIACGQDGLALSIVQPAGAKRMSGQDFLKGRSLVLGALLG